MWLVIIRRTIAFLIQVITVLTLVLIMAGVIRVFPLSDDSHPYVGQVLATIIPTTATFGIAALAIVFLTAQVTAANGKPFVLRELYRTLDVYILFALILLTTLGGYVAFVLNTDLVVTIAENRLLDCLLVLSIATVLFILPTLISQIENMDPLTLASKISGRLRPKDVEEYGLTTVESAGDAVTLYRLNLVGLRPPETDPLRPLHEILMGAVTPRDRVLFGKLFRHFVQPIATYYGAYWDPKGIVTVSKSKMILKKHRSERRGVHLTLALMHYAVKRAKNMVQEWNNLDIGRHGILTALGDLVYALAPVKGSEIAVRICLYATFHIERSYAAIKAYGRYEPMVTFYSAVAQLSRFGKESEVELGLAVIAWVKVHTDHLNNGREVAASSLLSAPLSKQYMKEINRFAGSHDELPGDAWQDPWDR